MGSRLHRFLVGLVALAMFAAPPVGAQVPESRGCSQEELDQLLAPIALYPDQLLMQVLITSTYPLEIVEAARWLKKNPSLKGTSLEEALKTQDWDPSVKSICGFPEVINRLNENLDWLQDLGDAFLAQQQALLAAVQRMRTKAYESGNLKANDQPTRRTMRISRASRLHCARESPGLMVSPSPLPM